jgi:hypothetical protein
MSEQQISDGEIRDELPEDLNASEFAGAYEFPDNSRRRVPGYIYLGVAAGCLALWLTKSDDSVLINDGLLLAAVLLVLIAAMCITSGWRMTVDEKDALVKANEAVDFPIGHASAQQVWRGLRSRPTWRVLAYSVESPPKKRAFVLIDAIDGRTVEAIAEDNPEDLSEWADDAD